MAEPYSTATETVEQPKLKGIGGWLILMAIGQVVGPLQILTGMIEEFGSVPEGTAARYPLAFIGDGGMRLAYVAFLAYVAVQFFKTRATFPSLFIVSYIVGLALPFVVGVWVTATTGINTLANLATPDFLKVYAPGAVVGAIWVAYVVNSVRVRNTFVN
jgi:hypothetical protein